MNTKVSWLLDRWAHRQYGEITNPLKCSDSHYQFTSLFGLNNFRSMIKCSHGSYLGMLQTNLLVGGWKWNWYSQRLHQAYQASNGLGHWASSSVSSNLEPTRNPHHQSPGQKLSKGRPSFPRPLQLFGANSQGELSRQTWPLPVDKTREKPARPHRTKVTCITIFLLWTSHQLQRAHTHS